LNALFALLLFSLLSDPPSGPQSAAPTPEPATSTAAVTDGKNAPAPDKRQPSAPTHSVDETVLVTATRSARAISELPVSATVIREEDVRNAPVRSVDDLLRGVAGVNPSVVSSSGSTPNNQRFSMHGLGGTRALVLLDGIPIHDPYSGIVQWQNVPLDSLRQIEVVRGGNASLFGNFALGGTVNLITRPVAESDISADVSYGSGSTARGALTVDYYVDPRLSVRVSHHDSHSNGFVRVPDPGPVDVDAWVDNANTSARADLHPTDHTSAFVNASSSRIDVSQGTPLTYSKKNMAAFSAGLDQTVGSAILVSSNAYYQQQTEHLVNSSIIGQRLSEYVSQDGKIPSTGKGASVELTMQRSGVIPFFSVGLDLHEVEATENRTSFNRSGAVTQRELVGGRQRFAGLFAQTSWRPFDRVEVLASARFDLFRNENGADIISGGSTTRYPGTSSNQLDPRVSVRYALGARSAVRGSVYRAFNAPTLRDLYRTNQSGNSLILGNPNLQPETLTGGEVGWEWTNDRARVEMNLYRSTIDGLQSRTNVNGSPNVFLNMNLGTSRSQGVELMGDVRLTSHWSMNAAYTYADAVITDDPNPALVGKYVIEVPKHLGALSLRYRGEHGTNGEVRGRISSRSYDDASNLAMSPAYHVIDLSLSQDLRSWLSAYVLVENALDESYYLALAANSFRSGLPRTVTTGFRIHGFPRKQP
jgi:outer membrane receptor protein involved in Fe transport